MSPQRSVSNYERGGFPRVSGDEPGEALILEEVMQFSPRERG